MDEADFNREVACIRRRYAQRRSELDLPTYVALSYDGIVDEAEQLALLDYLIMEAETWKHYWDAVNLIARRQLRAGNALPPPLANWIKDVLADQFVRKQKEKTRPRPAKGPRTAVRNRNVRQAVENLTARGFKATRRLRKMPEACAKGGSACDVVGAAFGENYKNTEGIWVSGKGSSAS